MSEQYVVVKTSDTKPGDRVLWASNLDSVTRIAREFNSGTRPDNETHWHNGDYARDNRCCPPNSPPNSEERKKMEEWRQRLTRDPFHCIVDRFDGDPDVRAVRQLERQRETDRAVANLYDEVLRSREEAINVALRDKKPVPRYAPLDRDDMFSLKDGRVFTMTQVLEARKRVLLELSDASARAERKRHPAQPDCLDDNELLYAPDADVSMSSVVRELFA